MSSPISRWDVPDSWRWAPLADIVEVAQNLVDPAAVPEMPHIAPNHIKSGEREILPFSTVRVDGVISPKQRFFPGQILFTKIRPYLLKSVLIDFEGVCSADMYPLTVRGTAESKLVLYWLTSPDFRNEIAHEQGRSVLPKINQPALLRSAFPLPPLPEQRRIVAKIDSLTAKSRRARDHLDHIPRLVEKYKQAILAAAFRGDLTREWRDSIGMAGWNSAVLSDVATIASGQTPKGIEGHLNENGELSWFKVSSMNEASNLAGLQMSQFKLTLADARALGLRIFPPGSIAFPKRGGAIATNKKRRLLVAGALDLNLMVLVAKGVDPNFLWWWVQKLDLASISNGSNVPQINNGDVAPLAIAVPPTAEQAQIAKRIETAFSWIDRLTTEAASARKLIDRLDQAVLAKAFRGELVPQGPADEPASVLLERIQAERGAAPKPRRGRRPAAEA